MVPISQRAQLQWWLILLAFLAVPALAGRPAWGQASAGKSASVENIAMNFKNVDILSFLSTMSQALDIAMVWDETKIRGTITLVSPKKFNRQDALSIFETVLSMHGYTTIRQPGSPVLLVVSTTDAPRIPSPTREEGERGEDTNFFVTQIIPLKYADANQIRAALTPLLSKTAGLAVYTPGNILLLSDTEPAVNRIVSIIKAMDVPPEDVDFLVIRLKHASARKIAPILTTLSSALPSETAAPPVRGRTTRAQAAGGGGSELKVVADERTNTLILVGDPLVLEKFKSIIATLDVPEEVPEAGVKVIRLEHADATELVKILKDINVRPAPAGGKPPGQPETGRAEISNATLTADKATNALIMFGPGEMLDTLSKMVVQLDVRRPQVYVEVLIMEMTLEKSLQLGVRWQATGEVTSNGVTKGLAGAGFPDATPRSLEGALATGTGSAIGIVGNEITFGGEKFTTFSGFIQATQQDTDLNVLANPQLLTLNNEEAEINVSQVVPVSTKTVTNNQLQTTTEFEFKDVGIILHLTPQITGEDKVRLVLKQESSSIAARQAIQNVNQQAITTLKRSINTQVVVDNNTTMAIGGLIQDQTVNTETKVPCLGDIPLLGWLFKSTSEELRKTNLIVFIRPRIITTREDLEATTSRVRERYDAVRKPETDADAVLRESFALPPANPATGEGEQQQQESAPAEQR
jgi:general secretion pathway protein D